MSDNKPGKWIDPAVERFESLAERGIPAYKGCDDELQSEKFKTVEKYALVRMASLYTPIHKHVVRRLVALPKRLDTKRAVD